MLQVSDLYDQYQLSDKMEFVLWLETLGLSYDAAKLVFKEMYNLERRIEGDYQLQIDDDDSILQTTDDDSEPQSEDD
ncbi:unnamed protein product [Cylicostephanus goldi]|uniref:Uncharacterized protein n=1 Tax=Cylicostephanus goldi TaxID=71465 RepID=A0A3P6R4B2_CYLGO|nr:unnamed protein product [Cylicostephanus goldi]